MTDARNELTDVLREAGVDPHSGIAAALTAGPDPRVLVLTVEDKVELGPADWVRMLKDAGFSLDSEVCPVKIRRPWAMIELADGGTVWIQWARTQ